MTKLIALVAACVVYAPAAFAALSQAARMLA